MKTMMILLSVGVLGSSAWWLVVDRAPRVAEGAEYDKLTYRASRGSLRITLTESGSLVAKESNKIKAKITGEAKIVSIVDEGQLVEEGEVVCTLDATALMEMVEKLELDILQAEADLDTAKTEKDIQEEENAASIRKAEVAVTKAKNALAKYENGDAPQKRREIKIRIKDATSSLTRKEKQYTDSMDLLKKEYIEENEVEEHLLERDKAQIELESAQLEMTIFEDYSNPMDLEDKKIAVEDANRELSTSKKRAVSKLRQKEVAVKKNEDKLVKLRKQLKEKREEIERMTLRAPCPGIVIHGNPHRWRREDLKVGTTVYANNTIITIPDLRVMLVKLQVHEADISKVQDGLSAKVTMDTYPGLVLGGKVTKVAHIAGYGGADGVKKFDLEVTLDRPEDLELKPGISARAEIFVDELKDVISLPLQCVFVESGEYYCYVLDEDGSPVRRAVVPGLSSETFVEIREGLQDGDQVLTVNPNLPLADETEEPSEGEEPEGESSGAGGAPGVGTS